MRPGWSHAAERPRAAAAPSALSALSASKFPSSHEGGERGRRRHDLRSAASCRHRTGPPAQAGGAGAGRGRRRRPRRRPRPSGSGENRRAARAPALQERPRPAPAGAAAARLAGWRAAAHRPPDATAGSPHPPGRGAAAALAGQPVGVAAPARLGVHQRGAERALFGARARLGADGLPRPARPGPRRAPAAGAAGARPGRGAHLRRGGDRLRRRRGSGRRRTGPRRSGRGGAGEGRLRR